MVVTDRVANRPLVSGVRLRNVHHQKVRARVELTCELHDVFHEGAKPAASARLRHGGLVPTTTGREGARGSGERATNENQRPAVLAGLKSPYPTVVTVVVR